MKLFTAFSLFILAFVISKKSLACHEVAVTEISATENGDGTYTYEIEVCVGIEDTWGFELYFNGPGNLISASPNCITAGFSGLDICQNIPSTSGGGDIEYGDFDNTSVAPWAQGGVNECAVLTLTFDDIINTIDINGPQILAGACFETGFPVSNCFNQPNLSSTDIEICESFTADLTQSFTDLNNANGQISYWYNSTFTQEITNPQNITESGTYYIYSETAPFCSDFTSISVNVYKKPKMTFTETGDCIDGTLTLSESYEIDESFFAIENCFYTIELFDSFGDGWNGNTIDVYLDGVFEGTYTLNDPPGNFTSFQIDVSAASTIRIDYNLIGSWPEENGLTVYDNSGAIIYNNSSIWLESNPVFETSITSCPAPQSISNTSFFSNQDLTIPVSNPDEVSVSGTYYIISESNKGCQDTLEIDVVFCEPKIEMPNVFTPDGSPGKNDIFKAKIFESIGEHSMAIFNKWGKEIYSTTSFENGWDGKNKKGNPVPAGTYYYIFNYKDFDGTDFPTLKGHITLLR